MRGVRGLGIWAAIFALVSDWGTKYVAMSRLSVGEATSAGPFLDWALIWNRGVSYGLLATQEEWGAWALTGVSLAALGLVWWFLRKETRATAAVGLGLLLGGGLGNAADRMVYGAVRDFVSFHVGEWRWYIFNAADVWITVGLGLLALSWLRGRGVGGGGRGGFCGGEEGRRGE